MLSEGEKEAIEQFKSWREYIIKHKEKVNKASDIEFYIRIILNLITKLQKENEEKDKEIKKYKNMIIEHKKQLRQSGIYGYDYDLKIDKTIF